MTGNPIRRHLVVPGHGSVWLIVDGDRYVVLHRLLNGVPIHKRDNETLEQAQAAWDDCLTEIGAQIRRRLANRPLMAGDQQWTPPDLSRFTDHELVLANRAGVLGDLLRWSPDQPVTPDIRQGWELMAALSEVG